MLSQSVDGRQFKNLLRPDEAADLLKVSRWTVYRWVGEGRLEACKIGKGSLRIFGSSVEKLIENSRVDFHVDYPVRIANRD